MRGSSARRRPGTQRGTGYLARWARREAELGPVADAIERFEETYEKVMLTRHGDDARVAELLASLDDIRIGWDYAKDEERLELGDGTEVLTGPEKDRVLEVFWVLYEAPIAGAKYPAIFAARALKEARELAK